MFRLHLAFILLCYCQHIISQNDCSTYKPWNIDYSDNKEASFSFMEWLYNRQYHYISCDRTLTSFGDKSGLGSSIMESVRKFILSIEKGSAYQPDARWKWASQNKAECVNGKSSIDCFTLPLTTCGLSDELAKSFVSNYDVDNYGMLSRRHNLSHFHNIINITDALSESITICEIAKFYQKPTLWIIGHILRFHMRYTNEIKHYINVRSRLALGEHTHHVETSHLLRAAYNNDIERYKIDHPIRKYELTAALHVRGGLPFSTDGRVPVNVSYYLEALQGKNNEIQQVLGPSFSINNVYLCSVNQDAANITSSEYMKDHYPSNYTYKVLPHTNFGSDGEIIEILSKSLGTNKAKDLPNPKVIYMEYIADVEILVKADIFIGTHSNVYALVGLLRYIDNPNRVGNHTCYLDVHQIPPPLICEGTEAAKAFWIDSFRWWGLMGGTPYSAEV